jgi:hypothetical protein
MSVNFRIAIDKVRIVVGRILHENNPLESKNQGKFSF